MQDEALGILDMIDQRNTERQRVDMVRGLVALGGPEHQEEIARQFPEYVVQDPFAEAYDQQAGEFDIDKIDDAKVAWSIPSPEEDADISAWIEEQEKQGGVIFTAADGEWK